MLNKYTFIEFNDSGHTERYEGRMLPGCRESKLMSASWKSTEYSVAKNILDWSAESGPFMIGRQTQGFL
jgi:hypothetical protein